MTLAELMKAVDDLSRQDFETLYDYLEQRREYLAEERIRMIEEAVAEIREGFSEQDLEELEWAMNVEYIEPVDNTE
jgi:hypothetical protein